MSKFASKDIFHGKEGASLKVKVDDNFTAELKQVEFSDASNDHVEGFSVVFEGPHDHAFDQGVHQVEHEEEGEGEMFLVPIVSKDPSRRLYEFVVSKMKDFDGPE